LIIFGANAAGFVDWIFLARDLELFQQNLIRIGHYAIGDRKTIGQDVSKLFLHSLKICLSSPLEALEQFSSFDRDALRKILRGV